MDSALSKARVDWTGAAFGTALAYGVFLVAMFVGGHWLRDAASSVIANDFIDVFAAGKLAAAGHAAWTYDWTMHRTAEITSAGHYFDGYYGWHYPPPFLFAAIALAQLPYFVSFFFWMALTLPLYAFVISRIADRREAIVWALAFPAVLLNAYVGQNGFLTAALFGAMLLTLEEQPMLSGIFLGLLTYKPQFGVLIPVALIAGGHWRALFSASSTALLMVALSLLAFGAESWIAFFHSIPHTTEMILADGHAGWNKLQTVYGFARWTGAGDHAAWIWQISVASVMALGLVVLWRSRLPFAMKAAALCAATLLATPYAYVYDFPLLAVAIAFLYRERPFDTREAATLFAASVLIASFPWTGAPVGLAATLLVASLVSRRGRKFGRMPGDIALQRA